MRKRFRILLIVLLVVLLGTLAYLILQPHAPEPMYQGKPLSFWLQGYDVPNSPAIVSTSTTNQPTRRQADEAIRATGTNALPTLLRLLARRDYPLVKPLVRLAQRQRFLNIHYVPPSEARSRAWYGFLALDAQAQAAMVPQLIALYDRNPDIVSQEMIVGILGHIGPPAKAATPLLVVAARSTNDFLRNDAVSALGSIHPEPAVAVPILIAALQDPVPNIRAVAARGLAGFGKDAAAAVPALLQLWRSEPAKPAGPNNGVANSAWGEKGSFQFIGAADSRQDVIDALKKIDPAAAASAGVQ